MNGDCTYESLAVETTYLDIKFDKNLDVEFYIRYCSPEVFGLSDKGIAGYISKIKPALDGTTGTTIISGIYDNSLKGLDELRRSALALVNQIYGTFFQSTVRINERSEVTIIDRIYRMKHPQIWRFEQLIKPAEFQEKRPI